MTHRSPTTRWARHRRATPLLAGSAALALLVAASACGGDEPTTPTTPTSEAAAPTAPTPPAPTAPTTAGMPAASPTPTEPEVIASDLEVPWGIAWLEGDTYVTERNGRLLRLHDDGTTTEVQRFDVVARSESGLLGLAAHDGYLYAYYTTAQDNRVVRFRPGQPPQPIVTGIEAAPIHDGGRIAFGPDGMLYVGTGDAAQSELARDRDSLNGKILRLTPEGEVPPDNPFPGSPVYSLGHRNVQGLAWADDGTMYAAEFGPDQDDEINRIEPGGNYGWPRVTGDSGASDDFIDPVVVRQPPDASWSGLAFHEGALYAASLRGNRVWRFEVTPDGLSEGEQFLVDEYGRLRTIVTAPDGRLWVTTSNHDGRGDPAPTDDRIIAIPTA